LIISYLHLLLTIQTNKKLKKIILVFILFFVCGSIYAQNQAKDSTRIWKKISSLNKEVNKTADVPDSLITALIQCRKEAIKNKSTILIGIARNSIGLAYMRKKDFEKAGKEFQDEIDYLESVIPNLDSKTQAEEQLIRTKLNYANTLGRQGLDQECLKLRLSLLDQLPEDKTTRSLVLGGVGTSYRDIGEHKKAITFYKKAVAVYDTVENNPSANRLFALIGKAYNFTGDLDSALYYYSKAKELSKDEVHVYNACAVGMAYIYKEQNKYAQATEMYLEAAASYPKNSPNRFANELNLLIALNYSEQGLHELAIQYFEKAEPVLRDAELNIKMEIGNVGTTVYSNAGKYKKAFKYLQQYKSCNDSLTATEKLKEFKEIESKYDVAKKQETINAQKVKIRNYGLGLLGLLAIASIAGMFFFNYRKQNILKDKIAAQEVKAKETEIESLKKENKLISMQSMIEGQEEERKRIAQDLHDNIGTLMTSIKMKFLSIQNEIESIQKMNIADELDGMINNASQEVRRISHRMTPKILEHAGLHDSVKELEVQLTENNIEVKSNIEALQGISNEKMELNIYRIVQEAYNNIIKHSGATKVSIVTKKTENELVIRIRDNGKGMSQEKWNDKNTLGLNGIKSRVNYLNGEIKLVEDSGTHFKITVPLV
jgi:signal transduction histidine kinase